MTRPTSPTVFVRNLAIASLRKGLNQSRRDALDEDEAAETAIFA